MGKVGGSKLGRSSFFVEGTLRVPLLPDTIRNEGVLSGRRKVKTWRLNKGRMVGAAEQKEFQISEGDN